MRHDGRSRYLLATTSLDRHCSVIAFPAFDEGDGGGETSLTTARCAIAIRTARERANVESGGFCLTKRMAIPRNGHRRLHLMSQVIFTILHRYNSGISRLVAAHFGGLAETAGLVNKVKILLSER